MEFLDVHHVFCRPFLFLSSANTPNFCSIHVCASLVFWHVTTLVDWRELRVIAWLDNISRESMLRGIAKGAELYSYLQTIWHPLWLCIQGGPYPFTPLVTSLTEPLQHELHSVYAGDVLAADFQFVVT